MIRVAQANNGIIARVANALTRKPAAVSGTPRTETSAMAVENPIGNVTIGAGTTPTERSAS